jgi:hypothetical protein
LSTLKRGHERVFVGILDIGIRDPVERRAAG